MIKRTVTFPSGINNKDFVVLGKTGFQLCFSPVFFSLQCRRILGGRNLVRVRNIVVAAIFDFMTVEDWGE